ncbi:3'-5' exonuclease [Campylobacter pinnipediorum]|uniref:3'-5' exonuclease n=1 Tax=Campylobacter pinnipediorum TaxID=1965231 RepID=UPI00084DDAF6|nr:3'-5' exonuclease [Campylobacter pinnipediorum]
MKHLENLLNLLSNRNLSYYDFIARAKLVDELTEIFDIRDIDIWQALGLDISRNIHKVELNTRIRPISEQEFCIVDIETNGGMSSGQIIEIGAIKIKNGVEIGRFESLVYAKEVPESITELTGIKQEDLKNAPNLSHVLEKFRVFLNKSVFVAHNVNFDYNFISNSMKNTDFGILLNHKICTIELAKRTIPSERYGLGYLKELLGINNTHHRALNDAISACEIFKISLGKLPQNVKTVEELIRFTKNSNKVKINQ